MKLDLRIWSVLVLVMVCFAANSVITRYLVLGDRVSPFLLTVIRFVSGLVTLLILTSVKPETFRHSKPGFSSLLGGFFLGAYAFSISFGYLFIPVGAGTFVFYTFVVLTMVAYSAVVDHERLTFRLVLGQLLGLLGVLVITFTGIHSVTLAGVLLMAATGTSWGLYSAFGKKFHPSFSYTFNSFQVFGAFAIVATIAIWVLTGPVSRSIAVEDLGLALYMGMVSTALSYVVWNEMVKKIPAFLGGLVQLIVPVLAPIMGTLFLREQITATLILGGGLVLIGIYTVQFRPSNRVVASKL